MSGSIAADHKVGFRLGESRGTDHRAVDGNVDVRASVMFVIVVADPVVSVQVRHRPFTAASTAAL